jgi:Fe-S cluster assembly iron-binding protein IscA
MLQRALAQRAQSDDGKALSFRLLPANGQGDAPALGLTLDAPGANDEIVEHHGCSVLVLDSATSAMLDGLTLDLVDTPEGSRLGLLE